MRAYFNYLCSVIKDVALSKDKAVSASDLITAHVMCPSVLAACWTASWKVSEFSTGLLSIEHS